MDEKELRNAAKVRRISGPGVEGMEDDPVIYHFDVMHENISDFILDPASFLSLLGIAPEGPNPVHVTFSPGKQGEGSGLENLKRNPGPKWCCTSHGDGGVSCHRN
ncbi:hypothetical protein GCM10023063_16500 [Arthrobacter methylotrophus]|uniref:Uncharacterized protein n=1 Tax=Arthrobacter methylotrophus TaxID=121291 RepID=A0ABV5UNH3_9MICC